MKCVSALLFALVAVGYVEAVGEAMIPDGKFFRVHHRQHIKMPYSCHDPEYCMHPTENPEDLEKMHWPDIVKDYVHCMDLKWKVVKDECVLPNGKILKKALRKEYRHLTDKERYDYVTTLNRLHSDGIFNEIGKLHHTAGIHSGPAFFPWHREFFKRLELLIRLYNPDVALPYWDSTLDNYLPQPHNSTMFSYDLMGEPGERGYVYDTVFQNWTTMDNRPTWFRAFGHEPDGELVNNNRIDFVMNQTDVEMVLTYSMPLIGCDNYTLDERFLEYSHDYVHYFISGDMQDRITSSNDPIFLLHHAFMDSLWEEWRQHRQRESDYPDRSLECAPAWHFKNASMPLLKPFTNGDALSNAYTDNLYEYAPRPACTKDSNECGSFFLFCDSTTTPEDPHCVARIKPGGNCTGFEWAKDACVIGSCEKGICIPTKEEFLGQRPKPQAPPLPADFELRSQKPDANYNGPKLVYPSRHRGFPSPAPLDLDEDDKTSTTNHTEPFKTRAVRKSSRFM